MMKRTVWCVLVIVHSPPIHTFLELCGTGPCPGRGEQRYWYCPRYCWTEKKHIQGVWSREPCCTTPMNMRNDAS